MVEKPGLTQPRLSETVLSSRVSWDGHRSPGRSGSHEPVRSSLARKGRIQGQVGGGSEQPDVVEDVPAHCREVRLDDL